MQNKHRSRKVKKIHLPTEISGLSVDLVGHALKLLSVIILLVLINLLPVPNCLDCSLSYFISVLETKSICYCLNEHQHNTEKLR